MVHEEWMAAVQRDFPDVTGEQLERTRDLMNRHAEMVSSMTFDRALTAFAAFLRVQDDERDAEETLLEFRVRMSRAKRTPAGMCGSPLSQLTSHAS